MDEIIELAIETDGGIIDCRLEPQRSEAGLLSYKATILYPNVVNGFSRSEIYCHTLLFDPQTNSFLFDPGDEAIHPKIKKMEWQLSQA